MIERRGWDPDELAAPWVSPPGLGRCVGIGSGIGVALAFVGIALPSVLSGMEWGAAVGFGAFVASWGGLGFGSMMGGVVYVMGLEKASDTALEGSSTADVAPSASDHAEASSAGATGDRRAA